MSIGLGLIANGFLTNAPKCTVGKRAIHVSAACCKVTSGRHKVTLKQNKPLTYEQANPPHFIGVRKSWNSWNTSNLFESTRQSETTVEDFFIRKFMTGTWHRLFASEIIIKRRLNVVYIGGIVRQTIHPRKLYFLIGYSEELLSIFLKCPVKIEVQSINPDSNAMIFKYI